MQPRVKTDKKRCSTIGQVANRIEAINIGSQNFRGWVEFSTITSSLPQTLLLIVPAAVTDFQTGKLSISSGYRNDQRMFKYGSPNHHATPEV